MLKSNLNKKCNNILDIAMECASLQGFKNDKNMSYFSMNAGCKPVMWFVRKDIKEHADAFIAICRSYFLNERGQDLKDFDYYFDRYVDVDEPTHINHVIYFYRKRGGIYHVTFGTEFQSLAGSQETHMYFYNGLDAVHLKCLSRMQS